MFDNFPCLCLMSVKLEFDVVLSVSPQQSIPMNQYVISITDIVLRMFGIKYLKQFKNGEKSREKPYKLVPLANKMSK